MAVLDAAIIGLYPIWALFAFITAAHYGRAARAEARDGGLRNRTFLLLAGIAATAFGTGLRALFWTIWRILRGYGFDTASLVLENHAFIIVSTGIVMGGYILHLHAYSLAEGRQGRWRRLVAVWILLWTMGTIGALLIPTMEH